jgi:hypothetical protein
MLALGLACLVAAADKPTNTPAAQPAAKPAANPNGGDFPEAPDNIDPKKLDPEDIKTLAAALAAAAPAPPPPGEWKADGRVYTMTFPRADLDVRTLDFGDVPVEAGLATTLRFFRCDCGKYYLIGEFCVTDYESPDVLDNLVRGRLRVASVAPMLLQEKPRLVLIRFQGEGKVGALAKTLADAFRWVGENREKSNPVK